MSLPLRYYDDPILRQRAQEIKKIDSSLDKLIKEMIETMDQHQGIGLAAPQIGVLLRVCVVRCGDLRCYLNPQITSHIGPLEPYEEGCLSIPGIQVEVWRPHAIRVIAFDCSGNRFTERLEGLPARVLLHEWDHLEGTLIIDRISSSAKSSAKRSN